MRDILLGEIDAALTSHHFANIWPAREVSLEGRTDLTPVTVGIWDSGVDVSVYPGQFFTNPGEIPDNGKDDDGNGYIDDVHGIAYDIDKGRVTGLMLPDSMKGKIMGYWHGTSVTGVALRGNPAARILFARGSQRMGGHGPQRAELPPTLQRARNFAQEDRETIAYFRQHGVRVVNMSWGFNPNGFEATLAAYNIGTPEEQRRLAREIFDTAATALRAAMAAAPEMLFVVAAANDGADVSFNEEVAASFDLSNLIVVGAADAAGGAVALLGWSSNHGKVDVFAEGFEVPSKAPGGSRLLISGTSAAAPQVTNLAAKLLAMKPTLTVAELRRAILESADEKTIGQGKRIKLLNPRAAFDLIGKPAAQATQPQRHTPGPTVPAITAADLATRLYLFADDSMQGRRTGEPGNLKAAAYIEREVRRLGLTPAGDSGGYFQTLPLVRHAVSNRSSLTVDGQPLQLGTDYRPFALWPTPLLTDVQVIYAGDVARPEITAEQARGRFVVLTRANRSGPQVTRPPGGPDSPLVGAAAIGIVAIDQLAPEVRAQLGMSIGFPPTGPAADRQRRPMLLLSARAAELLLGAPLNGAQVGATGKTVRGQILYEDSPAPAPNVVAILPGSDPKLRHEYVALGAHSDHVGAGRPMDHDSIRAYNSVMRPQGARTRDEAPPTAEQQARIRIVLDSLRRVNPARPDSVFNGADDDGSGSVALLEIAERLATQKTRPRRSILFVWHTGEELGALGSKWFVEHPTVPLDSIVAQLTLDMIGRGGASDVAGGGPDFLQLIGSRRLSTELGDVVEAVSRGEPWPFRLDYGYDAPGEPQRIYCSGDNASYSRLGIPVTAFFTGLHRDYHQVSDEAEYIDYAHLARITQLVRDVALRVADLDHRLVVDKPMTDPAAPCVQ
ncbi:MAG TPA: M20/M25/M40 family metallo-hydrolase [Gemmatimonadaceae bacterium]